MTTKREQILSAIAATLSATAGVSSRIYRSRVEPLTRAESPALIVEPVSDVTAQNTSLPTLDHTLSVRVVLIIRAAVPDQAADPIIESLHSALMADLSLGGLCIDIQPTSTEFTLEAADTPVGVIFCNFRVLYRTQVASLSA